MYLYNTSIYNVYTKSFYAIQIHWLVLKSRGKVRMRKLMHMNIPFSRYLWKDDGGSMLHTRLSVLLIRTVYHKVHPYELGHFGSLFYAYYLYILAAKGSLLLETNYLMVLFRSSEARDLFSMTCLNNNPKSWICPSSLNYQLYWIDSKVD